MQVTEGQIQYFIFLLDLNSEISYLNQARSYEDAQERLNHFKEQVKRKRKEFAKKFHPDINKDRSVNAEDKMKEINNACDTLMLMEIRRPQPIVQRVVVVHGYYGSCSSYGSATTATYVW